MSSADLSADILNSHCLSRTVLRHLTDRWTPFIVTVLADTAPHRFTAIRQRIQGISPKVLTETLRSMERDGLVDRQVTASIPPRVEYQLTALGLSVVPPIEALRVWAEAHMEEVEFHRAQYDARHVTE